MAPPYQSRGGMYSGDPYRLEGAPVMPLGEPFVNEWSNRSGWNKGDYKSVSGRSDRSDLSEKKPLADPFVEEWLKTAATRKPEASKEGPLVQHLTVSTV